ncbi:interferon-induced protein 44-like [Engraulis encrasicolus]|uniref:interferon-induced protein 44-like n=1 Tax=Engraulis encrasicolus TaxID=184585 RepID=UPI002FD229B3
MCDMMGLERGEKQGVHTDDIIKVLHGNLKDGYQFSASPVYEDEPDYYNESPTLDDRVHCLVSVVSANTVTLLDDSVVHKIKTIRLKASNLGIPQVVVLTHVDQACPHVIDKLENVYRSRKIKEKMEVCSNRLGVPMTCIFPVKNYHEEVELEGMVDTLLLHSFKQIVTLGNNYISTLTDIKMENDYKGTGER